MMAFFAARGLLGPLTSSQKRVAGADGLPDSDTAFGPRMT